MTVEHIVQGPHTVRSSNPYKNLNTKCKSSFNMAIFSPKAPGNRCAF